MSHSSYRTLYTPLPAKSTTPAIVCDTTWMLKWPQFGRDLVDLLESIIYLPQQGDMHTLRQAIKNSSSCEEILQNPQWCDRIADIKTKIRATGLSNELPAQAPTSLPDNNDQTGGEDEPHDPEQDVQLNEKN